MSVTEDGENKAETAWAGLYLWTHGRRYVTCPNCVCVEFNSSNRVGR